MPALDPALPLCGIGRETLGVVQPGANRLGHRLDIAERQRAATAICEQLGRAAGLVEAGDRVQHLRRI